MLFFTGLLPPLSRLLGKILSPSPLLDAEFEDLMSDLQSQHSCYPNIHSTCTTSQNTCTQYHHLWLNFSSPQCLVHSHSGSSSPTSHPSKVKGSDPIRSPVILPDPSHPVRHAQSKKRVVTNFRTKAVSSQNDEKREEAKKIIRLP